MSKPKLVYIKSTKATTKLIKKLAQQWKPALESLAKK